jgi:hypothetical protein
MTLRLMPYIVDWRSDSHTRYPRTTTCPLVPSIMFSGQDFVDWRSVGPDWYSSSSLLWQRVDHLLVSGALSPMIRIIRSNGEDLSANALPQRAWMSNSSVSDQIGSRVGLPARRTLQREFGLLVEAVEERMYDPGARHGD